MYFPYFRGRQYELLALRELAQNNLLDNKVVPVVEPIKISSTFSGMVKIFQDKQQKFALILNPQVGDIANETAIDLTLPFISSGVIPSAIMGKSASRALEAILGKGMTKGDMLAIMTNRDYIEKYSSVFANNPPQYTLFPDERSIRRAIGAGKVMFEDKFNKQGKNADYLNQEDEFFSDDHLHFEEKGFAGFGDYSIVGDEFVEGGFAPRAVAIHIVYFAQNGTLRIMHFVSDSNIDIADPAGKYGEAVRKLKKWYDSANIQPQLTTALAEFLDHAEYGKYPGLPTIKKLSIMHHLELVGKYLSGGLTI